MREVCGDGSQRARQFAIGALLVGRLDALDGGLELIGFFHRLRQEMHARADGQHLPALAGIQLRHRVHGGLFGAGQMIVVAHAERIVDRDDQHLAAAACAAGAADKRIGEGQRDQQQQGDAQREQQQVAQAAVLDGALRAPLEEHQRAEGMRRAAVLAQQMDLKRQADRHRAGQKPGGEKTHVYILPFRIRKYSRSASSSGRSVGSS